MEYQKRVDEAPTLGAYVCELRPGSACICCGAPLRWADCDDLFGSTEWTRPLPGEARVLRCPDCSCEIGGVSTQKAAAKRGGALNRAA